MLSYNQAFSSMPINNLKFLLLNGKHIQLEPIMLGHREALRTAANDERIWRYMPQKAIADVFNSWFDNCLQKMEQGHELTYVIRQKKDQMIIGSTAYYDISLAHKRLTLGYSWLVPAMWGTTVNPEIKLLMLTQAFEKWGIHRIEIGTDSRNKHSYHAIKKLGAIEEGILRQHMILHDGTVTDTILFSILLEEWPKIKKQLEMRISPATSAG